MSVNVNTTTNTIVVQNANQTITVVDNENANIVNVTQPLVNVIEVASPGPQGPVGPTGPQGPSVPFTNIGNDVYATTSSLQVTGSFLVSGSSTFTNIGPAIFSGSVNATSGVTMSSALVSGDVTVLGTASINVLQINTTINSTGSNQLGDAPNDTQTLYGTVVIPTGSLTVSGSAKVNEGIFGIGTSGTILPLVNTAGTGTVVVGGTSPNTPALRIQGSPLNFFIGSTQVAQIFATTGNLLLQNGGTFTDLGYKLAVSGGLLLTSSAFNAPLVLSDQNYIYGGGNTSSANAIFGVTSTQTELYARNNRIGIWGSGGSSNYLYSINGDFGIGVGAVTPSARLHISGASSANLLRIDSPASSSILYVSGSGNVGIGTGTPAFTLDVSGSARVRGVGNTGTTTAFTLTNSDNINTLQVQDNGYIRIGSQATSAFRVYSTDTSGDAELAGLNLVLNSRVTSQAQAFNVGMVTINGPASTATSGTQNVFLINKAFYPTSGTATYAATSIISTINQTGGANGITRGLYINPTLIAAADFRAIETTAGNVLFGTPGTGFFWDNTNGRLGIGIATPAGKLDLYDSTTSLLYVRTGTVGANWQSAGVISQLGTYTNHSFALKTNDAERMRIVNNGNVLIGTTTDSGYKLDVSGSTFSRKLIVGTDNTYTGAVTGSDFYMKGTSAGITFTVRDTNNNTLFAAGGASGTGLFYAQAYNIGLGTSITNTANKVHILSNGATSTTTALLIQNSTPTNLLSVLDNGQVSFTSPTMSLAASQSAFSISPIISASNVIGGQYYGVSITPTFFQTTGSQTETAFRVAATYNQSSAVATSGTNVIADFGSTSAGSQLTVTDVTSGSIYMVNDVSGIPIIEATSNWDVNIYDFPNKVFEKTGSQVNIYGTMRVSGSFILPLSQSVAPQTGSAYWSGSFLFIYDGTRYRSSSFA